jgi:peptidyl-tRNA hydrolase, PTH1 family
VKLIVGLGNPGAQYANTRHNLGFLTVDRIAALRRVTEQRTICAASVAQWAENDQTFLLAKPLTYMNRSGEAVKQLLQGFSATPEDLVVVCDDLDLPFGRIRVRSGGGSGGHLGLASILDNVAGAPFGRVRIGVGRPPEGITPVDYVLGSFDAEQSDRLHEIIDRAADAVLTLLHDGPEAAMRRFNRSD